MIKSVSESPSRRSLLKLSNFKRNPINPRVERNLAITNATGVSLVAGGLTASIARTYTSNWRNAGLFGLAAGLITMMFVCPRFLYKSGINSYTKEKEIDVFTKEKEVQQKLLSDVEKAIDEKREDLPEKINNYSKTLHK